MALVAALVAASALFWALRLFVAVTPVPANTTVAANGPLARSDLTRLLGADPPPPALAAEAPPDARFQLIGVVAARALSAAAEGLALIAVDGKPPKAYRVGAVVDGQTILKSVAARGAQLGLRDGAVQVSLNLAPLQAAATGTLPGVPDMQAMPASPAQAQAQAPPAAAQRPAPQSMRRMLPTPARPALAAENAPPQALPAGPAAPEGSLLR